MRTKNALLILVLAAALAVSGCASLSPDELAPESLALPPDSRHFDGSVSVSAAVNVYTIRLKRPKHLVTVEGLAYRLGMTQVALLEALALKGLDFPSLHMGLFPELVYKGGFFGTGWSIGVDPEVFGRIFNSGSINFFDDVSVGWAATYVPVIKGAFEESLEASGLFSSVVQAQSDYVLDVWLEWYEPSTPKMGMGTYKADVAAIWRLTRVRDGRVLACDFVEGHGSFRKPRAGPTRWAFNAAVQDLIGATLRLLADGSRERLAALLPAGLGRQGTSGLRVEGADEWSQTVRKNWPQLQASMGVEEVVEAIGPLRIQDGRWECTLAVPVCTERLDLLNRPQGETGSLAGLGVLEFQEYRTDLYTLLFMEQRMYKWNTKRRTNELETVSPPSLVIWQLKKK